MNEMNNGYGDIDLIALYAEALAEVEAANAKTDADAEAYVKACRAEARRNDAITRAALKR